MWLAEREPARPRAAARARRRYAAACTITRSNSSIETGFCRTADARSGALRRTEPGRRRASATQHAPWRAPEGYAVLPLRPSSFKHSGVHEDDVGQEHVAEPHRLTSIGCLTHTFSIPLVMLRSITSALRTSAWSSAISIRIGICCPNPQKHIVILVQYCIT